MATLALACHVVLAANVDPDLAARAAHEDRVEALLVFPDQAAPVITPLDATADYKLRRRALVDSLRARANAQQSNVRTWLDARGIAYRAYWISNLVWTRLSAAELAELASRNDLARIEPNAHITMRFPPAVDATFPIPDAIESTSWGVTKIDAPRVWAAGFNGQGVVIAGQDTGYQWDHPALKSHYRGWDGASADHDYNWHDSIHVGDASNSCGLDMPAPCDDSGHGTHTAGTFAGGDGGSNVVGVAPGAKWIGCRNMDAGDGTPQRYIECMQWLLAPTDLADADPNPDLAPDIVSNSWGCPASEGCTVGDELEAAVDNLVAGGIFFAAAAANDGPSCSTITDPPAIYGSAFVVGATDSADRMASFSSRGPVMGIRKVRPDVSAPGVSVRSAWNNGGYTTISGTSMATPHVAGAAALLMSVNPALKGQPEQVAQLLRETAVRQGITDPYNIVGCGRLTIGSWPNYQAGYGRINAWAAVVLADTLFKDGVDDALAD